MKHRIQEALCRLASVAYQTRYVTHGTSEEYVLPEELLDSTCSIIETTLKSDILIQSLKNDEAQELSHVLTVLRRLQKDIPLNEPTVSNYDLIQKNASWLKARNLAQKALEVLGCNLADWERKEGVGSKN
jgi:hypothetical protein